MPKKDEIVVGLDLGTTKVCAVVAERSDAGMKILGVGTAANSGMKQGMVTSIEETTTAIGKAVDEARGMAEVDIFQVVAGVSGAHLRGVNNQATTIVSGSVTKNDVTQVLDTLGAVEMSRDEEIIYVAPQRHVLDGQDAIANPVGMAGERLTVEGHVVTGAGSAVQNLTSCVEGAGLTLEGLVPQPLASAMSVLSHEELELGVALVDIGGGTTDLAIFAGGSLCHTWVLPLGGSHVTSDIAYCLSTSVKEAERLKVQYGHALAAQVDADALIEVTGVSGHDTEQKPQALLAEITEARMEEILELVGAELSHTGLRRHIGAGVVITGGGSLPPGTCDLAVVATGMRVRAGIPVGITGLKELAATPQCATAVGLARCALDNPAPLGGKTASSGSAGDSGVSRVRSWFKDFF